MPNNLQRIVDEVKTTVTNTLRSQDPADVLNTTGMVLQHIVDKFEGDFPDWLMVDDTFTTSAVTKDLSALGLFTYPLYQQRVREIWVTGYDPACYTEDRLALKNKSTYSSITAPSLWSWDSYQTIIFDGVVSSTININYQREVGFIDSQTPPTKIPDIPGFDGFNLLLAGVKSMLKADTAAVDTLEQDRNWQDMFIMFYRRHAIRTVWGITPVYQ